MARNFLLLYNPISGKGNSAKILEAYENLSKQNTSHKFLHHPTDKDAQYIAVKELIHAENISDVIIAGGDGSVNQVVHALHKLPVQFGIVPRGSGNGLALAAGIPKAVKAAFQFILNNPIAQPTDAFLVNDKFACMLAGLGFDAQVAAEFAISPTRGLATYTKLTIKNFVKAKPHLFTITASNTNIEVQSYLTCIANSNQFGNKFTIAPKAQLNDGLLDVVVVGKMNKLLFLLRTIKQVAGFNNLMHVEKIDTKKSILYFQAPELSIQNSTNAPLHIDGEAVATYSQLHFKVLPSYFKLIRK